MAPSRRASVFALLVLTSCAANEAPPPQPPAPTPVPTITAPPSPPPPTASTHLTYPAAPRHPVLDIYRDARVYEEYQWLEDGSDPAVKAWSDAENDLARTWLDAVPGRDAIRGRLEALVGEQSPSWSDVRVKKGVIFALERRPPKQHPYLVVLPSVDDPAHARVLVDPDALDSSGATTIDFFEPSNDGKLVAVSLSAGGSESGDVHVFEVATGKERTGDRVTRVNGGTAGGGLAWKADDSRFFYTRYPRQGERPAPDLGFYQQVYSHKVGDTPEHDTYALGHDAPRIAEWALASSADGKITVASMEYGDGGEFNHWVTRADQWEPVAIARDKVKSVVAGPDGALYCLSFKESPKGKVLRTPASLPDLARATVVVAEGDGAIQALVPTKTRLYLLEQVGGVSRVRSVPLPKGGAATTLAIPAVASVGAIEPLGGDDVLLSAETFTTPRAWYRTQAGDKTAVAKTALAATSHADFSGVDVTRETCPSKDGTSVPISILRAKSTPLNGANPTLLTGYGGFGISVGPRFRPERLFWLEHGGVYAVANIRGGGEFGEDWHRNGSLTHKQNVFDDFYTCAQHLALAKYTSSDKLGIEGGSNGGLLMGAELTQHPEMFKAVVSHVGIYDMIRLERDANGAFNVTEYGSVTDPKQFEALYAYSPYHHVRPGMAYPAALFMTGANDPRVNPYHSRKMVARLQFSTSSDAPILLRTSANTGHGIGTPLHALLEELTDSFGFLTKELGVALPGDAAPAAPATGGGASPAASTDAGAPAADSGANAH